MTCDMSRNTRLSRRINHRPDIAIGRLGGANHEGLHRAAQHPLKCICDIALHIKHPQCRAALTGRLKGADNHILNGLLEQGRTVDNHGVQPAGFGNQGCLWR